MLNKTEVLSILVKLEDSGINIDVPMKQLVTSKEIPVSVLQFIVNNRGIEASNFYEMLRKKYNDKKSSLYINIVNYENSKQDAITTLVCLLTQIVLYSNKLNTNKEKFLEEVRAEEITRVLNEYFESGTVESCTTLLNLIKSDLVVLEGLSGRREFE